MIISYFGFKEHDALFNFWFLWIIATAFFGMWDAINVVGITTQSIKVTWAYYFLQWLILLWLVLTFLSVVKQAKEHTGKTKIVNVVDEDFTKDFSPKKSFKWLFDEEEDDDTQEHSSSAHHTLL